MTFSLGPYSPGNRVEVRVLSSAPRGGREPIGCYADRPKTLTAAVQAAEAQSVQSSPKTLASTGFALMSCGRAGLAEICWAVYCSLGAPPFSLRSLCSCINPWEDTCTMKWSAL